MTPADLERLIDRELKRLPGPRAPQTLLPRVMAAVARQALARTPRGWSSWPRRAQAASVAALLLFAIGSHLSGPAIGAAAAPALSRGAEAIAVVAAPVQEAAATARVLGAAASVIWRLVVEPFAFCALVMLAAMCAACVTFGLLLSRVALGGALHS